MLNGIAVFLFYVILNNDAYRHTIISNEKFSDKK